MVNDGAGLTLECQPSGKGWWRLRWWVDGKANRQSLGTFPEVSLAMARQRRNEKRQQLASGVDPSASRKQEKADRPERQAIAKARASGAPMPGTFEAVAREWLAQVHSAKVSEGHAARTRIRLEQDVFPWPGAEPVSEVKASDLLKCLRRVVERGAVETAHRVNYACSQVFRYAIRLELAERNPAADLSEALPAPVTKNLAAIVEPVAVGQLLRNSDEYVGHPVTRTALRLSPLLLLRPGELRQMEWEWVDLEAALITVPSQVMKRRIQEKESGAPHLVPLARQAVEALRDLQPLTGSSPFVFPSLTAPTQRCMSSNTVRSALRRMGYDNDEMTAHGFRAMARTMAAERLGVASEVIEAQLAHAVSDPLGRAYNRTQFLEQRRAFMQEWADYLDRLRVGGQVVELRVAR